MLKIYIANKNRKDEFEHVDGPLEFGRGPRRTTPRIVLSDDPTVSTDQLLIEERPGGRLWLRNLSRRYPVRLATGEAIPAEGESEVSLPARLGVGNTLIQVEYVKAGDSPGGALRTIMAPMNQGALLTLARLPRQDGAIDAETLARWFESVMNVQRASASSGSFYQRTAQAVVELIGLDCGLVLLRREDRWEFAARFPPGDGDPPKVSQTVLDRVLRDRQTFYQDYESVALKLSITEIEDVVAAPVLDDAGKVVGAVYGARFHGHSQSTTGIRPIEAQLVQVLAVAVAAGLARLESESQAARRRVQFEQFFSSELARELDRDPSLLEGQERDVTVLFSDIRGYSRFSSRLSPADLCRLIGDVMDCLTEKARMYGGVVVSYMGDGLMVLWNAPTDQPDHAELACRAALAMNQALPQIDALWRDRLGLPLRIGIGINSGKALVGNTGSRSKFMYGPQGAMVNLASRVEGVTKQLGVAILMSGTTHELVSGSFLTRRLCSARVVGLEEPVELFQLHEGADDDEWRTLRKLYETGLEQYESSKWRDACRTLGQIVVGREGDLDQPTLALLARSIDCLRVNPRSFDPVIRFDQK
jgi:adenylate cyclase